MAEALCIGGTRFIGRATVDELLATGYDVTVFTRGNRANPFEADDRVSHRTGDRRSDADMEALAAAVDPDAVVDLVAYYPRDVRVATDLFADVGAYVFVSSGAAYETASLPKREDDTPLESCTEEQATDDTWSSYGPRKAEGDRVVFAAAERGVNAMSIRPPVVYGPHDYTDRFNYWVQRVRTADRVLVPGDGTNIYHRVFVDTVARGIRTLLEHGRPGEAYNVADRRIQTLAQLVAGVASAAETDVEIVTACDRELAAGGLEATDFPLYLAQPHVLSTAKLAGRGWEAVPVEDAVTTSVAHRLDVADGSESLDSGPDRGAEESVLGVLETL